MHFCTVYAVVSITCVAVTYHGSSLSINYTSVAVVFHTTVTCVKMGAIIRIRFNIMDSTRAVLIAFEAADLFQISSHLIVS
mmetsp:Transcript_3627/g.5256  ORF Transcript_3627/g.5256 Transcript_3627/m.5256 type:complete len:81 (-) Transcript_3627:607-849(-)